MAVKLPIHPTFYRRSDAASTKPLGYIVIATLSFLILPNLPYSYWLKSFAPTRAIINVDYLLLGVVSVYISRRIVTVLFAIISAIDAFVFISTLYHFTPRELIMSMHYARYSPIALSDLPWIDIFSMAGVIFLAVLLARKISGTRVRAVPISISGLIAIIVLADIYNGSNTYALFTKLPFYTRTQHVALNPANSGLYAADLSLLLPIVHKPVVTKVASASQIATRERHALAQPSINVALIIVESWGQIDGAPQLTKALTAPLLSPAIGARYNIAIGSVPFHGSTTNAELRELCGVQTSYRDLFDIPRPTCLTDEMARHGYEITGMHGFHGDMFDRKSWWPLVGIQKSVFLDDFQRSTRISICGTAFPGLCDSDLVTAMGNRLTNSKQFVYGLTINSHLPLARSSDWDGVLRCSTLPVPLHAEPCALAQKWRRVFAAVAANALRPDIRPTQFVIVGDHSPPLLGTGGESFSALQVPYIILTPRSDLRAAL